MALGEAFGFCLSGLEGLVAAEALLEGSVVAFARLLLQEPGGIPHGKGVLRDKLLELHRKSQIALPPMWVTLWEKSGTWHTGDSGGAAEESAVKLKADRLYNSLSKALQRERVKTAKDLPKVIMSVDHPAAAAAAAPPPLWRSARKRKCVEPSATGPSTEPSPRAGRVQAASGPMPTTHELAQELGALREKLAAKGRAYFAGLTCSCGRRHNAVSAINSLILPSELSEAALRKGPALSMAEVNAVEGLEVQLKEGKGACVVATQEWAVDSSPLSFDSFYLANGLRGVSGGTPYSIQVHEGGVSGERHPFECSLGARVRFLISALTPLPTLRCFFLTHTLCPLPLLSHTLFSLTAPRSQGMPTWCKYPPLGNLIARVTTHTYSPTQTPQPAGI
jgi:hypothetical protein